MSAAWDRRADETRDYIDAPMNIEPNDTHADERTEDSDQELRKAHENVGENEHTLPLTMILAALADAS